MPVRPTLELSAEDAAILLNEGLVGVNRAQMLRRGPQRPRVRDLIAQQRLRYSRIDPDERWQSYEDVLSAIERDGVAFADCEDLASMAAAEEDLEGDAGTRTAVYRTGPRMNHVVVSSPSRGLMDPSISAGMGWNEDQLGRVPVAPKQERELAAQQSRWRRVPGLKFGATVEVFSISPLDVLARDLAERR